MKDVLVSIIMPCYKAAGTLEKSVESIVAQTHTNWELLLLEDGSPDESLNIARQCARADQRIRLIATARNRGVVRMRNIGIRLAKGQWIAFCDADDWWIPQKLQLQLALSESRKANLVYSAVIMYATTERCVSRKYSSCPMQTTTPCSKPMPSP